VAFSGCEVMRRETNIQKLRLEKENYLCRSCKRNKENKTYKEVDMVTQEQQQSYHENKWNLLLL